MVFMDLLVVIPHSGIVIPPETPLESFSDEFPYLARNVDWYTNWLYDFRDILANRQIIFPYCSLILEGNRHPDIIETSVPLKDVYGKPLYKTGKEPDLKTRNQMADKYLRSFHDSIRKEIEAGAVFLFDGHSTVSARGVGDNQIELMSFQHSDLDPEVKYYCPEIFIQTYAEELRRRLPDVKVTVNQSEYYKVYGHVCAEHSVNALTPVGTRVPAFLQETNERLYKNPDGTPNIEKLNRLRIAFAESIYAMYTKIKPGQKEKKYD